jgi:hypothetical protein
MPFRDDTKVAILDGLRAALCTHMIGPFQVGMAAHAITPEGIAEFKRLTLQIAERYEAMVEAVNDVLRTEGS